MYKYLKFSLVLLLGIILLAGCQVSVTEETLPVSIYTTPTTASLPTEVTEEKAPTIVHPSAPETQPVSITETTSPSATIPAPAEPLPTTTPANTQATVTSLFPEMEQTVLQLMNEHRAHAGVEPLAMAYAYYDCAEIRARECITYFSHTRPDGRRWSTVYSDLSLCDDLLLVSENLARHFKTAEDMVQALMDSPSHRRNILDERFQYVAICILPVEEYDGLYAMSQLFIQKED